MSFSCKIVLYLSKTLFSISESTVPPIPRNQGVSKRKKRSTGPNWEAFFKVIETFVNRSVEKSGDSDIAFGRFVAASLRQMAPDQKNKCMTEIVQSLLSNDESSSTEFAVNVPASTVPDAMELFEARNP